MPTNYGDENSRELYMDCLGKLHAMMYDSDIIHTLIAGDFNCSPGSRFFDKFKSFCDDNNMVVSDISRLSNVHSDDDMKMSWVDHVMATRSLDAIIGDINILDNVIVSDHKPVSFCLNCSCKNVTANADAWESSVSWLPCWQQCDESTVMNYQYRLDKLLQAMDVPWYLLSDLQANCDVSVIHKFYQDMLSCVSQAMYDTVPVRKSTITHFNVPGWNTYVKEKHDVTREAYINWASYGKPKIGTLFENMKRSRALFKLALRYHKNHIDEMKADTCADMLMD